MAKNLPYQHPSVSELAKALRKSIHAAHNVDIGHSDMLQLLAKAVGFQNYQSFKSLMESETQEERGHLINVSCNLHEVGEVFERDLATGQVIDRRHRAATNILALVTLTIKTPSTTASVKCNVVTAAGNLSERDMVEPEKTLARWVMQHIAHNAERFFGAISMMGPLEVVIDEGAIKRYGRVDETTHGELILNLVVNDQVLQRIVSQSQSVNQATRKYEDAITFLKNLAFSDTQKLDGAEKEQARSALHFIEQAMDISTERGMVTMYSWNHEKFPAIARFFTALINGKRFSESDKQSAMRNLSVWRAGEVWVNSLPV